MHTNTADSTTPRFIGLFVLEQTKESKRNKKKKELRVESHAVLI
jgi:hypothetical protein